jgi:hypothetical protein
MTRNLGQKKRLLFSRDLIHEKKQTWEVAGSESLHNVGLGIYWLFSSGSHVKMRTHGSKTVG